MRRLSSSLLSVTLTGLLSILLSINISHAETGAGKIGSLFSGGMFQGGNIESRGVTNAKLHADSVDGTKIAPNAVTSAKTDATIQHTILLNSACRYGINEIKADGTIVCAEVDPTFTVTTVNGSCGSANGTTVATAPTTNLCADGSTPAVSGTGPWNWTCIGSGSPKGTDVSCSASVIPAGCPANSVFQQNVPTCTDYDPDTGDCINYTYADECVCNVGYAKTADGQCNTAGTCYSGTKATFPYTNAPTGTLCLSSGGNSTPTTNGYSWNWTCYGDAYNSNCSATVPKYGYCADRHSYDDSANALKCAPGSYISTGGSNPISESIVNISQSFVVWACLPTPQMAKNFNYTPNCIVGADCGPASQSWGFANPPTDGLCYDGTPSAVTSGTINSGATPAWVWTCSKYVPAINKTLSMDCSVSKGTTVNPPISCIYHNEATTCSSTTPGVIGSVSTYLTIDAQPVNGGTCPITEGQVNGSHPCLP